jgi:hydroxymethylbilane synthase
MPLSQPQELGIAAVTERISADDAFITVGGKPVPELPPGSRIGTCSARRKALILNIRPDLAVVPLRGNVDTRLKKLRDGECAGTILAVAGLMRLKKTGIITQYLSPPGYLPAPGQGCLALETRRDDMEAKAIAMAIHHQTSCICAMAERSFLKGLGGGCNLPLGAFAEMLNNKELSLRGSILSRDGKAFLDDEISGPLDKAVDLGAILAGRMIRSGALELIS